MTSLAERLWGKTKSLAERLADKAKDIVVPASVINYSSAEYKEKQKTNLQTDPSVVLDPKKIPMPQEPVKVEDGALVPQGAGGAEVPAITTEPKDFIEIPHRKLKIQKDEVENVLKPMIYSEVSSFLDRPKDKVALEIRTVLNTVLNRSEKRSKSITDIINEPNQYQGVGSKKFTEYATTTDSNETRQLEIIDETINDVLEEIKNGTFTDSVGGAEFYGHMKDGTIRAFDTWEEYQKAIDAGLVK